MNLTDLSTIFNALPSSFLILKADRDLTIVEVNDVFCKNTNTIKNEIIGLPLFFIFPENPNDVDSNGKNTLKSSYQYVISKKIKHEMGVFKYDIQIRNTDDYEERHWQVNNYPVFDTNGNVEFIINSGQDVTESVLSDKISKQEVKLTNDRYKAITNATNDIIWDWELVSGKVLWNNAIEIVLGFRNIPKIENIEWWIKNIHPEDRERVHNSIYSAIDNHKEKWNDEYRLICENGEYKYFFDRSYIIRDEKSNAIRMIGSKLDITERRKMEEEISRSEFLLSEAGRLGKIGGWEADLNNNSIWTKTVYDIFDVDYNFDRESAETFKLFKPSSREVIIDAVDTATSKKTGWDLDLQLIKNDKWVRSVGEVVLDDNNDVVKLRGVFIDINDYKVAEDAIQQSKKMQEALNAVLIDHINIIKEKDLTIEKTKEFQFLADSIPQIVWTSKPDGNLDYYNQFWFDYTGMTLEETLGWGWKPVLHPDDLENCVKVWTESYTTGKPYNVEYRFKRASDGVYKWHLGRALPMKNEKGEIVKWFGTCTDIDEYKKAIDLQNQIIHFEDFNQIVAHNLRGPAGSIKTIIDMISDSPSLEEKEDLLGMLKKSSNSLNNTLNELMSVLEVRNNKNLTYDNCDLHELVINIENMLTGEIHKKGATIETHFEITEIKFPKIYLESIFYNLISNSLKYSRSDVPPKISICSKLIDGKVMLTFSDNGLGIDLNLHGKNMFKLNKIFHKGFDSKGVGLFMTKTQIETFGGKILVESEPNAGTKFIILLK